MQLEYMLPKDIDLEVLGNRNIDIDMLNLCNRPSSRSSVLSYVTSDKYFDIVKQAGHIKAILCRNEDQPVYKKIMEEREGCLILSKSPEVDFYIIHETLYYSTNFYNKYEFPTKIGNNCNIHESAVVDRGGTNRK